MKRLLCFIAAVAMMAVSAAAQSEADLPGPYLRIVEQADSACVKADWPLAESLFLKAMRMEPANPSNVLLMSNLGMVRFYQGNDSMALSTLDDALRMAPNATVLIANRAKVLSAMGRQSDALADWERVLAIDSLNVDALYFHVLATIGSGDSVSSVADLQRLELLAPGDVRTNFAKATFLTSRGLYAQAVGPLRKVVEASPRAEHYASLAIAHIMSGSLSEAADDIARGLEIDPAYGELYLYRALLNKLRYRPADARADAQRAVSLGIPKRRAEPLM
ncbi:MAG: hypothetical protein K2I34_08760 [Paramuribaculum sp.]|nr:hypothetical protein [Paramuribaculum sp.]MDE5921843.1 hypothetical protein [Paramuribaculum sp.]